MKNMRSIRVILGVAALLLILVIVQGAMAAETYGFVTKWGKYGSDPGQFYGPHGVAVDSSIGNVYVTDQGSNRVEEFTADGTYVTQWGSYGSNPGQFDGPTGISVDSSGYVYVVDGKRVQKFTSDGKTVLANWGSLGSNPGQFQSPEGIAINSSGDVYVVDTGNDRIEEFTSDGKTLLANWGSYGLDPGQFYGPMFVAIDSSDNVYVTDYNNNRVQKFTPDGKTVLTNWGSLGSDPGQFNQPWGVTVDSSDNVYVTDYNNDRVQKFTSEGKYVTQWGSYGDSDGQLGSPAGIAVSSSGNVYVADQGNYRIQEFTETGTTGSITITSTPTGAEIFLDGVDTSQKTVSAGTTLTGVSTGSHTVKVTLAGYQDASQQVSVIAGTTTPVDFQLQGTIVIFSTPTGAEVYLDNVDTGLETTTGGTTFGVPAGTTTVKVTLAGYQDASQQVIVSGGSTAFARFMLVPGSSTGAITVTSTPTGAEIYLDGADTHSVTPTTLDGLSSGSHKVKVTLTDYQAPAEKDVPVAGGQTTSVTFPLVAVAGDIAVTSDPGSAEIYLDGFDTGIATKPVGGTVQWVTITGISPGPHTVKVSLQGYMDASQQVTVTAGSITSAKFQMVPVAATGSIHVTSDPDGSKGSNIFLDGVDTGQFTDATLTGVTPGIHTVQAGKYTLPFYTAAKQQVIVTAGQTTEVHFDMKMYGIGSIYVKAGCPVDITVTDPQGHTISSQNNDIPGASYVDLGPGADGRPDPMIAIPASDGAGTYLVTVIPKPGTQPTDTYTLDFIDTSGKTIVLADNVPIGAIPDKPYSFTIGGTSPVPEYPVPAVPILCIAIFALGIFALKSRRD
jgi:DNA-binding beta-propeller fold protein YncE